MANYNFFEPYIEPPKKLDYERLIWIGLLLLVVVLIVISYFLQSYKMMSLKGDIEKINNDIAAPEFQKTLKEVSDLEVNILDSKLTYDKLALLEDVSEKELAFDYDIFKEINTWVPLKAFITRINYSGQGLTMDGYGEDLETVAVFERQISNSDKFYTAKIDTVTKENDNYKFTMNTALSPFVDLSLLGKEETGEAESDIAGEAETETNGEQSTGNSEEVESESEDATTQSETE